MGPKNVEEAVDEIHGLLQGVEQQVSLTARNPANGPEVGAVLIVS